MSDRPDNIPITPLKLRVRPDTIRPMEDYVLVRHLSHQEKIGSIHIPETAQEGSHRTFGKGYSFRGEVVSVGPGSRYLDFLREESTFGKRRKQTWFKKVRATRSDMLTKPGDVVWFERRRETELDYNGETYSLLHEAQSVLAVEEPSV